MNTRGAKLEQTKVGFFVLSTLLLMVPFIQLGLSYYLSVQVLALMGLLFFVVKKKGLQSRSIQFIGAGALLFVAKALVELSGSDLHEVLLVAREMFCFALLILSIKQISPLNCSELLLKKYRWFITISCTLIAVQYVVIFSGSFISFPIEWFIANQGTLEGVSDAVQYQTRLRPVGFYGEPSYMAFVLLSAFLYFLSSETRLRPILVTLFINVLALVLLGSMSGILALFCMMFFYVTQDNVLGKNLKKIPKALQIGVVVGTAIAAISFNEDISERILNLSDLNTIDPSTYIRYVMPVIEISKMMGDGFWMGYSGDEMERLTASYDAYSIDNAFFYLILHYGILGPLIISIFLLYLRQPLLVVYALVVLNFNGAYFTFDKVVVMSLAIGLSLGALKSNEGKSIGN